MQKCAFPTIAFIMSTRYDSTKNAINWFNFDADEQGIILENFHMYRFFCCTLHEMGEFISRYSLDYIEITFVCAINLYSKGNKLELKEMMMEALRHYIMSLFIYLFVYFRLQVSHRLEVQPTTNAKTLPRNVSRRLRFSRRLEYVCSMSARDLKCNQPPMPKLNHELTLDV
ncbi:hypothetical protein HELRODRAFT_174549 [Helobdella robusta]|uniref:NR LBD domain-containing protein n=1 Tax=Helobdella robusta TaxID=6412 RepID=T1F888_HELRO|nr:hypothetical protein HELRODRAFT_174549 [Helobdella robusta]ESO01591.1 hypothetical protein HELRODRAFT_174549 [Helobdella robusta]